MKFYLKLFAVYFLIESVAYIYIHRAYNVLSGYNYFDWVYYFYNPSAKVTFYYYLYFIFTTSLFFSCILFIKIFKRHNQGISE